MSSRELVAFACGVLFVLGLEALAEHARRRYFFELGEIYKRIATEQGRAAAIDELYSTVREAARRHDEEGPEWSM